MSSYKTCIKEKQSGMFRKSPLSLVMRYSYIQHSMFATNIFLKTIFCIISVLEKEDFTTIKKFLNMKNILVIFKSSNMYFNFQTTNNVMSNGNVCF